MQRIPLPDSSPCRCRPLRCSLLLLLAGWAAAGLSWAQTDEVDEAAAVVELQALVGKVVDLEAAASEERLEWAARKEEMASLLKLHREELALLDEELSDAGASAEGFDERREELQAGIAALNEARRLAVQVVVEHRERALKIASYFPAPLRKETEGDRLALESWKPGDEARPAIRAILGMVTAAEQFNRGVRRSVEEREGREVEVVYLGLARAYYVGKGGSAGVGEPGPGGWTWRESNDLAGAVQDALAQLEKRNAPELIELPVRIQEGGAE